MEYKYLTPEVKIPVLGLGTWTIGGKLEPDYSDDVHAIESIKAAIRLGYTHIDVSEMYGAGHTEELIGIAIKDFPRKDLFITTKVVKTNLGYDNLIRSAKNSLQRLDTDYIDLYMIQSPSDDIPLEETMRAMNYLVDVGLVKHIGVSNRTRESLIETQGFAEHKIVANQIEYSLLTIDVAKISVRNKNMESETIPYCQEHNIMVIAELPLERGLLLKSHPVLDALEKKYHKTKAQIALNWLISKKNIITIPKSTNIDHLKENLGALGRSLSPEDMQLLDNANFQSLVE